MNQLSNNASTLNESTGSLNDLLMFDIGAPFVIGLAVGYFAKKAIKVSLFIGGLAVVLLFFAEYYGLTEVNSDSIKQIANTATDAVKQSSNFLVARLSNITGKGLSSTAGFFTGLKLG